MAFVFYEGGISNCSTAFPSAQKEGGLRGEAIKISDNLECSLYESREKWRGVLVHSPLNAKSFFVAGTFATPDIFY
jgi:hypothetical protein